MLDTPYAMNTPIRLLPHLVRRVPRASSNAVRASSLAAFASRRCFSTSRPLKNAKDRGPPKPPSDDKADAARSFLGTQKRLPEFNLTDKIILVSGGARGLGLTQAEALLEAGATGEATPSQCPPPISHTKETRKTAQRPGN